MRFLALDSVVCDLQLSEGRFLYFDLIFIHIGIVLFIHIDIVLFIHIDIV